ncbi:ATP-binding protein [Pseudoxanthomonas koreensis]|nr:ATP-binding protein [Pseudoxanthomonas koreensis]
MARSLRWRLLLAAAGAILLALALAWVFMTLLFERHLERRLEAEMTRDALGLVADLVFDAQGRLALERQPGDARMDKPAGGYYWQVSSPAGVLRSRSLWDSVLPVPPQVPTDGWRLQRRPGPFEQPAMVLERTLQFDSDRPAVVVQLAQDTAALSTARGEFGRELAVFLLLLWCVLTAAAWLQVSVGLRPLRRIPAGLEALERSADARLPPQSLQEVQPLVDSINALADARQKDLEQARRRASDLAHGLKTPLAALAAQSRRAREAGATEAADGMEQAISTIKLVVDGELARMRLARLRRSRGSADVGEVVERLASVIEHTEKGETLALGIDIAAGLRLPLEPEQLSEIMGALMENAARHAVRQIRVTAAPTATGVRAAVEDDGPGLPPARLHALQHDRGDLLDSSGYAGDGLGLLIVRDLVGSSQGRLQFATSTLGGLQVAIDWQAAGSRESNA